MTQALLELLRYATAMGVGVVIGVIGSSGKVVIGGRARTIPYIEKDSRNFTMIISVMVILSLAAMASTAVTANQQTRCNTEFRRVLADRAQITSEDATLNKARGEALSSLVTSLLEDHSQEQDYTRMALERFQLKSEAITAQLRENEQRRAESPYPSEPQCDA